MRGCLRSIFWRLTTAALPAIAVLPAPAAADAIAEFYAGKQIRIYIRAAAGGNYDIYSRVLGRHLTRHIDRQPDRAADQYAGRRRYRDA